MKQLDLTSGLMTVRVYADLDERHGGDVDVFIAKTEDVTGEDADYGWDDAQVYSVQRLTYPAVMSFLAFVDSQLDAPVVAAAVREAVRE